MNLIMILSSLHKPSPNSATPAPSPQPPPKDPQAGFSAAKLLIIIYEAVCAHPSASSRALRSHKHHTYCSPQLELKLQNLQVVDAATKAKFFHPFMQALCMFVGEALVGIVLLFQYLRNRNK